MKGRTGGGGTRQKTGAPASRPRESGMKMSAYIETEGLRMQLDRELAKERMLFEERMLQSTHTNHLQVLATIGSWFNGGARGGGGGGLGGGGMGGQRMRFLQRGQRMRSIG